MNADIDNAIDLVCSDLSLSYALKTEQRRIIRLLVDGRSVFGLLPTGYGKSHCFALTPLVLDKMYPDKRHTALVISPLRSLMLDLVARYSRIGISSVAILKWDEMKPEDVEGLRNGTFTLILSSPEAVLRPQWWAILQGLKDQISCFTIDEAHCLTTWGKDFRHSYKDIVDVRGICSTAPLLLLTATATQKMVGDILKSVRLDISEVELIAVLPDRPNIYMELKTVGNDVDKHLAWIGDMLKADGNAAPKTIIYARTIDKVTQIFGSLMLMAGKSAWVDGDKSSRKLRVDMYHGSTAADKQAIILRRFTTPGDSLKVVVATVAFGMGVQVDDVKYVLHWGPSNSVLDYWQEIGRCARDGSAGTAILYVVTMSLNPKLISQEMVDCIKDVRKNTSCLRKAFLTHLFVEGMSKTQLDTCSSTNIRCCSHCDK